MVHVILLMCAIICGCFGAKINTTNDEVHFLFNADTFVMRDNCTYDQCGIITNQNEIIKYEISDQLAYGFKKENNKCTVRKQVNINDSGMWQFKTCNGYKRYFIFVSKETYSKDIYEMNIFKNDYAILNYPITDEKIIGCYLYKDQKEQIIDVLDPSNDLIKVSQCGVQIRIVSGKYHNMKLIRVNDKGVATIRTFGFKLEKDINLATQRNEVVYRGTKNYLLNRNTDSQFCIITDPHGEVVKSSPCNYNINEVTSYHSGIWTLQYYPEFSTAPIQENILLEVKDMEKLKIHVNKYDDEITIICNTTGHYNINACKFRNPNNNVINVFLGIANNTYEYYGEGYGLNSDAQECGIVIHKPNKSDYGIWKCLLSTEDSQRNKKAVNSLINISNENIEYDVSTKYSDKIYVKEGNPLKIMCAVNKRLSYCFLRSPNGTNYFITSKGKSINSNVLSYEGSGLNMGECGAILPNANKIDAGEWSCHMGIKNGQDIKANILVMVLDTIVVPTQDQVKILTTTTSVDLSCTVVKGSTFDKQYCRWISPNGVNIFEDYDSRYIVQGNSTMCSITIKDSNLATNIGKWRCLVSEDGHILQATIELNYAVNIMIWVVAASTILAVILSAVSTYIVYKWVKNKGNSNKQSLVRNMEIENVDNISFSKTQV